MSAFFRHKFTVSMLLVADLVTGCSSVGSSPTALPFPDYPHLLFFRDASQNQCLSPEDAAELDKWIDKLRAFEAAGRREGVLR